MPLGVSRPAFFQPAQLGRQASNLGIQFADLLLVRGDCRLRRLVILTEQAGQTLQSQRFPALQLVGMDAVLSRNLIEGLFLFQDLLHNLSFELISVPFAHGRIVP